MYSLTVLKAGSPKSRCEQGCGPSEGSRQEFFLDTWLPVIPRIFDLSTYPTGVRLHPRTAVSPVCPSLNTKFFSLCVYVQCFSFYEFTSC